MPSKQVMEVQANKVGYRDDNLYGEKVRDLQAILEHEMLEMGNVDVLDTMEKLYPACASWISEEMKTAINNGTPPVEEVKGLIGKLVDFVKEELHTTEMPMAIWVCATKKDFMENYSDGTYPGFEKEPEVDYELEEEPDDLLEEEIEEEIMWERELEEELELEYELEDELEYELEDEDEEEGYPLHMVTFNDGLLIVSDLEEQGVLVACRTFFMEEDEFTW